MREPRDNQPIQAPAMSAGLPKIVRASGGVSGSSGTHESWPDESAAGDVGWRWVDLLLLALCSWFRRAWM